MSIRQHRAALGRIPAVRTGLFLFGWVLIASAPIAGLLPGPGGIFVFAAGAGLVLKNSEWAKRKYVAFKRRHPRKGGWADWGMRRKSALRRQARERDRIAGTLPEAD
ncbi:MAG TPA: hypothetical protein VGC35_03615 [Allosphingosinicella sp.]|jgi:hypothetical protein